MHDTESWARRIRSVIAANQATRWDGSERRQLQGIQRKLQSLPIGCGAHAVFAVLAHHFPVAGGVWSKDRPACSEFEFVALGVPSGLLDQIHSYPDEDVIVSAGRFLELGHGVRDLDVLTPSELARSVIFREILPAFGLQGGSLTLLSKRDLPRGAEYETLLLYYDRGDGPPSARDMRMLGALQPQLRAALDRSRGLLSQREPLFTQVLREQRRGYVIVRTDGTIVEANQQAVDLARRLVGPGRVLHTRETYLDCVLARLTPSSGAQERTGTISLADGTGCVEASIHRIDEASRGCGGDLELLLLRDLEQQPRAGRAEGLAALSALPPRQRDVARLLGTTAMTYDEVAATLRLATGTVRKHAEWAYRRLAVHSRAELAQLLLGNAVPE